MHIIKILNPVSYYTIYKNSMADFESAISQNIISYLKISDM